MKKNYRKILILQTAFLGDVLLTLPMIHHLRKKNQDAEIDIIVRPEAAEVGEISLDVSNVFAFDKRNKNIKHTFELIKTIRSKKYELLISPHRSFRSSFISYLSGIPKRICFDNASFSFLYTDAVKYQENIHEVERNLSLISEFAKVDDWKSKIPIRELQSTVNKKILGWMNSQHKIICIAPFSEWFTKKYPDDYVERLIELIIKSGSKVVLLGAKRDRADAIKIEENINSSENLLNLTGQLSIRESVDIIQRSNLLICNDSAPTHMAMLTSCPVLTIFGSTIPGFGFYPYRSIDSIIQVGDLYCKPCGIHGHNACPEGHFRCMKELEPEKVFDQMKTMTQKE